MKTTVISIAALIALSSALMAMSPYEEAKMKKYGKSNYGKMQKNRQEMQNIDKSGSLEEVKSRYLSKIASKKRNAPSMMQSKIAGIESCINRATTVSGVEGCIPSMMK